LIDDDNTNNYVPSLAYPEVPFSLLFIITTLNPLFVIQKLVTQLNKLLSVNGVLWN